MTLASELTPTIDRSHPQDALEVSRSLASDIVTADRLEEMCSDYQARIGFFEQREVVGIFRRASSVAVVWRQWSSKTDDEYVAEIVIVEKDGRYLVDHAMIF